MFVPMQYINYNTMQLAVTSFHLIYQLEGLCV